MTTKQFARAAGVTMLAMGLAAFIPALSKSPARAKLPPLRVKTSYGKFLGLFPLNIFNKSALAVFGALGIAASMARTEKPAVIYARLVAAAMAPLAILGVIPRTRTLFGTLPLFGNEIAAHGTFAGLGAYYGLRRGPAN